MKNLLVLASIVAVIGVAVAYAQNQSSQPIYPSGGNTYVGGYQGGYRAATAGESHMRGMSDLVRSAVMERWCSIDLLNMAITW